jgi:hypothetical protein
VTFRSKDVRLLEETLGAGLDRLPVETIDNASRMVQFQAPPVRPESLAIAGSEKAMCCGPTLLQAKAADDKLGADVFCGRISATGMVRSTPSGLVLPEVVCGVEVFSRAAHGVWRGDPLRRNGCCTATSG